jgi:hypothetical protein
MPDGSRETKAQRYHNDGSSKSESCVCLIMNLVLWLMLETFRTILLRSGPQLSALKEPEGTKTDLEESDWRYKWADFTHYQGQVVPLGVVRAMMEEDGLDWKAWNGRSIPVSEKAFEVVEEWYKDAQQ